MTNENEVTPVLPVKFSFMEESITSPIIDLFPGQDEGMVQGEPGGFVFTREYGRQAQKVYEFEPRKDDTWVCTFSKSGNQNCVSIKFSIHLISRSFLNHTIPNRRIPFRDRHHLDSGNGLANRQRL